MKFPNAMAFLAMSAAALFPACVRVDYEGEKREPKPARAEVKAYFDKSQIPVKDYKVMGRAVATAPSSYTASEVERKLVEDARKQGADGVLILSIDRIPDGEVRDDQIYDRKAPGWNVDDSSENGWKFFQSSIENAGRKSEAQTAFNVRIKALFLDFPDTPPVKEEKPSGADAQPK